MYSFVFLRQCAGVVPVEDVPAVVEYLVNDVMHTHGGHISTGIVGARCDGSKICCGVHVIVEEHNFIA